MPLQRCGAVERVTVLTCVEKNTVPLRAVQVAFHAKWTSKKEEETL